MLSSQAKLSEEKRTSAKTVQEARMSDRLAAARRGRFVGREAEIALFRSALLADEPSFAVLYIYGPGGVGKTSLLHTFARITTECGRPVIHLDGRNLDPSPPSFLLGLRQALGLETEGASSVLSDLPSNGVLLIDTYETLAPLDIWLRETFLPQLSAQSLVVIAGRNQPAPAWRTDMGWADLTRIVSLSNLRPEESRTYLAMRGVPEEKHADVLASTHGHPLALSLVADVLNQSDPSAALSLQDEPDVVRVLLERFITHVPSPLQRQALEVCAYARVTTEALLTHVLGEAESPAIFDWLRGLSFIEHGPQGLFPHDLARDLLEADLRWRNPEGHPQLHQHVRHYVTSKLQAASGREQPSAYFDFIYTQRNNPLTNPLFDWQALGSAYATPATTQDYPAILEMVRRHEGETSVQIARYWLQRQPQAFTLFCAADQQPFGFMANLALQTVTPQDQETDPALKAAWAFVQARGLLHPGAEMTYKRFWMGRETHQQVPSVTFNMVVVVSFMQWVTNPRLAWSFAVYLDPDDWQRRYAHIDFQRAREADFTVDGQHYGVFAHDWHAVPVPEWLEALSRHEFMTEFNLDWEARHAAPLVRLSEPEFAEAVRQALRDYTRPDLLTANPLLSSQLVTSASRASDAEGAVPYEATEKPASPAILQALLREAVATLTANPKDMKFHRAIWHTYLEPAPTQEVAAELLDLPFGTYRYHLAAGIKRLTEWLWRRELNAIR